MKRAILASVLLLVGCEIHVTGHRAVRLPQGWFTCTDLRDGERFRYHTDTIRDVWIGSGGRHTVTVTDSAGQVRVLKTEHESFLKCLQEPQ